MFRPLVIVGVWLIGSTSLADVSPCAGQASPHDSTTVARSDSVRPHPDNLQPAPATQPPVDSTLSTACIGSPGGVASDLLVILFTPSASRSTRTAVAKSVHGRLLGPTPSGDAGSFYLAVPSGGNQYQLQAIADRLIQFAEVQQVGTVACPPAPAPPGPPQSR